MDKNEYRVRLDQITELVDRQDYRGALQIVDSIDWRRVKSARTLCMVGEIYEANKRYEESKKILLLARQRAPIGKTVLYRLTELSVKTGDFDEAASYYKQFVELSPNDNTRYILKYKIYRGRKSPIEDQITVLEEYKGREYTERWAFELARLYAKAGMTDKCIGECDDIILWFSEGKYVTKAMELKMKYAPLTPSQKAKYENRYIPPVKTVIPETESAVETAANVAAAATAASKVVSAAGILPMDTDELPDIAMPEEETVRVHDRKKEAAPSGQDSIFTPFLESTVVLQDKIARGLRDVFAGKNHEEEDAQEEELEREMQQEENAYEPAVDEEQYVVKDLEPENIGTRADTKITSGIVSVAVPETAKEDVPVKKEMKEISDVDIDAILAEVTGDLAKSVGAEEAEMTKSALEEAAVTEETESSVANMLSEAVNDIIAQRVEATEMPVEEEAVLTAETEEEETLTEKVVEEETLTEEVVEEPALEAEENPVEEDLPVIQEIPMEELLKVEIPNATKEVPVEEVKEARWSTDEEEILRHRLTKDEMKHLFTYFEKIPGMTDQIVETLETVQDAACEKTSRSGNIAIIGRAGTGKTKLSESVIKAMCKERKMEGAKVAYIDAKDFNKKDPAAVVANMAGGFLVLEKAGDLEPGILNELSKAMEFRTNRLTVILEDCKQGIRTIEENYPEFAEKFNTEIVIPVFTNDELVSFAKTYAKENGYKIEAMGVLALYTLIGENQTEENPVAIAHVKEMVDEAMKRAAKNGRRPGKKVSKRHLDEEDGRILIYEKDFDA